MDASRDENKFQLALIEVEFWAVAGRLCCFLCDGSDVCNGSVSRAYFNNACVISDNLSLHCFFIISTTKKLLTIMDYHYIGHNNRKPYEGLI